MPEDNSVQLKFTNVGLENVKAASSSLSSYRNELKGAQQEEANLTNASGKLKNSIADIDGFFQQVDFNSDFQDLRDGIQGATDDADALNDALKTVGETSSASLGGSRRFINTAGSIANQVAPGSGETFRLGGDILEFKKDLPKVQEALASVGTSLGEVGEAGLIAAPAIIGVAIATKQFNDTIQASKQALDAAIAADNKYYQDVTTLTNEQANQEIDRLTRRNAAIKAQVEGEIKIVQIGAESVVESFQGIFNAIGFLFGDAYKKVAEGLAAKAINTDVTANLDKLNTEYETNNTAIIKLKGGLEDGAFAANDMAEATKKATAAGQQLIISNVENQQKLNEEINQLQRDGSEKELEQKRKAAKDATDLAIGEVNDIQKAIDAANARGEDTTVLMDKQAQYFSEYNKASEESLALSDAALQAQVKQNDADKEHVKIVTASADATKKYDDDLKKNQDDLNKGLADSQQKYNDQLVAIAEQGAKAAEQALEKLVEKQADLATSFGNAETDAATKAQQQQADASLKFQQEEAKAAKDHAAALLKIQADAKDREFSLILDRDFAGLFNSKRQTTEAMNVENQKYNDEEAARAEAYANQQALDAEHYAQEEENRKLNYQRQLAAAQLQYTREQQALDKNFRDANTKAYNDYVNQQNLLAAKYNSQLLMLNQNITDQLTLIAGGDALKLQLEAQYYAQSQALIKGIYSNGGSTQSGAGGGNATPTQNIAGGALDIPNGGSGVGLGFASTSNNNSRNFNVSVTQHISGGADSGAIARAAAAAVRSAISDLVS